MPEKHGVSIPQKQSPSRLHCQVIRAVWRWMMFLTSKFPGERKDKDVGIRSRQSPFTSGSFQIIPYCRQIEQSNELFISAQQPLETKQPGSPTHQWQHMPRLCTARVPLETGHATSFLSCAVNLLMTQTIILYKLCLEAHFTRWLDGFTEKIP